jgi:hypothetical protein
LGLFVQFLFFRDLWQFLWQFCLILWQQPFRTVLLGPASSGVLKHRYYGRAKLIRRIVNIFELYRIYLKANPDAAAGKYPCFQ